MICIIKYTHMSNYIPRFIMPNCSTVYYNAIYFILTVYCLDLVLLFISHALVLFLCNFPYKLNINLLICYAHTHSFSGRSGQIWLDNVDCSSSHTGTLADCSHSSFGIHNCTHSDDVILVCVGGQSNAK